MNQSRHPDLNAQETCTRTRILLAAGPIFAGKGYRRATVREICDKAKVNVASINYHFRDKQNLYRETVLLAREMRAQEVPRPDFDPADPADARLRRFIEFLLRRVVAMQSGPWQVKLLIREFMEPTDICRVLVQEYFRPIFVSLLNIIDDLAPNRLSETQRVQTGFSIIGQCLHYRFSAGVIPLMLNCPADQLPFTVESLADHITTFSLAGIRALASGEKLGEPSCADEQLRE